MDKRRVLIVSPHFPPINAPDHQRVRMALPYFKEFGWQAHVLAVKSDYVEGVRDEDLLKTIPEDIPITYIKAIPVGYTKYLRVNNLGWRCLPYLAHFGAKLLKDKSFDLIYFSTTIFLAFGLGSLWFKRFGVPYILDFQDPWLSDYFQKEGINSKPPGGNFKYGFARFMAQNLEPRAMRYVSHVTSVSDAYPKILQSRYSWLNSDRFTTLPFGGSKRDFNLLSGMNIKQNIFNPNDGNRHWVYVGRGGDDMAFVLKALFSTIERERIKQSDRWKKIRLHFIGTSYAKSDRSRETIKPIAIDCGVGDLVSEYKNRVPYFEALQILVDSDAILLIGSDDPNYSPSKIYPCVLAKKKILGILHEASLGIKILKSTKAGKTISFKNREINKDSLALCLNELIDKSEREYIETNWSLFENYTAKNMTEKLCNIFDRSLDYSIEV